MWSGDRGVYVECRVWSLKCGVEECGVRSGDCRV